MLIVLLQIVCVVFPAQAVLSSQLHGSLNCIVVNFDTGPIHIHKKARGPQELEYTPLLPNDVVATQNADIFLQELLPTFDTKLMRSVNRFVLQEVNAVVALHLYDFMIQGFQRATMDNLAVRLGENVRVDFNLSVFFVNGLIDKHHFASIGNISTFSNDVKVSGMLTVAQLMLPSNVNVFQIVDADITIDVRNIMISLKILQEIAELQTTLEEFTKKPLDDLVNSVSRVVVKLINEELAQIPVRFVVDYLVPPGTKPSDRNHNLHLRAPTNPHYSYEYLNE
ncbi:hypothetical protein SFRURICE_000817 [Spodoptera frugiperda]|nr:hypothetical protein SFRURICE_000817 [Spodoptera frugiperda]